MADKKEKKNEKKIERKKLTEDFDDEEFAKELAEATNGTDSSSMSDEEYLIITYCYLNLLLITNLLITFYDTLIVYNKS